MNALNGRLVGLGALVLCAVLGGVGYAMGRRNAVEERYRGARI